MTNRIGQQLGNYRIVRPIGQGGFADVYLGEHIYLQTQVAIKLLQMRLLKEDTEEFLKEARTIAHLVHPHIVRVLDFGIEGGTPFLVMDYAPNGTLRQRHPKSTALPLITIISYVKQIADALQYAHDAKLIHRDVKPENMLLGRSHEVLLSDFGIALVAQSSRYQSTQEVIGTVAYMAPEQIQGKPRPASDQYSLGIIVYEWLSGDRPFHGSFTELCTQHMFAPPPLLRDKLPLLPPVVEQVVMTALEKDPYKRFASMRAFAIALEQACQRASSPPIALPPELLSPHGPSLSTNTVATSPSNQPSSPSNAVTSFPPPTKALSATTSAESFSLSNLMNNENITLVPKAKNNSAFANQLQSLRVSKIVLLIGLTLLVLIGSLGVLSVIRINQMSTTNAYATANAQMNTTNIANTTTVIAQTYATATATVTAQHNIYVQATSGTPTLDDPLINNSKGDNWDGGNACVFTGGAYHVKIGQKDTFLVCSARPTLANFAYQVQMTILKGDGGGITFRTGGANPFGYRFFLSLDYFDLNYGDKNLASSAAIKANLNQTYLLTAIVRGGTISLYVDKQWVTTVEDNAASSGGIGLMAVDFNNEADVAFRNAQVWNL